jgi:thiamine-phosphate pyrophosphorylase
VRDQLQRSRLYAICDLGYLTFDNALPVSRLLLEGGAGILQLRAKGHDPGDLITLSLKLKALCEEFGVPFIVNDHLKLAIETGASGLHLGQDDGSLEEARRVLGPEPIIGRSTHSLPQARDALSEGADYIGFGPLFPTPTKKGRPAIGLNEIATMEKEVGSRIPAFCIGGIKPDNLEKVLGAGARRFVVVSHLLTAGDPLGATSEILNHQP